MPRLHTASLFDNGHACEICHRPLPEDYTDKLCPACKERELFSRVKDYIRSNDVTEYNVAVEFGIPVSKVKSWIREGRIEYKPSNSDTTLQSMHCQQCGAPITFGTVCQRCLRKLNTTSAAKQSFGDNDRLYHKIDK